MLTTPAPAAPPVVSRLGFATAVVRILVTDAATKPEAAAAAVAFITSIAQLSRTETQRVRGPVRWDSAQATRVTLHADGKFWSVAVERTDLRK